MPDTVAITGATGFIGARLLARLSARGISVRALHRGARVAEDLPNVHWVRGALEQPSALEDLVGGADAVIHCAGAVRGAGEQEFSEVNVEGVRRLVAACAQVASPPRLLHVSSLAAKAPHVSPYAASKRAGEQVLEASTGIAWTIFRPPAVYGPGDRELKGLFRTMARGIGPYPGSLDSRVSLIHVDDLVAAVLAWLEHADTARRLFELDDGCRGGYAWRDVLETMERVSGRSMLRVRLPKGLMMALGYANLGLARVMRGAPMLTPGKVRELYQSAWVADARGVEEALDWHPSVSLESGLRALLEAAG